MTPAAGGLVLVVASLLTLGVVMVTSAGVTIDQDQPLTIQSVLLGRPAAHAGIAFAAMLIATAVPVWRLRQARWVPLVAIGVVVLLLAVYIPGLGREVNGARRWLDLRITSFQPSEAAKWLMPLLVVWYATRRPERMGRFVPGLLVPLSFVGLICGLIALEDLGTAVLIGLVALAVLLAAGARPVQVAALVPVGIAGLGAAIVTSPYRLDRLRAFLDPASDPQGIGYHLLHSLATVSGGGLLGRGLGNGIQKFGYLPEATTDFIFAIICEELGIVGAATVIGLFGALAWLGWSIVSRLEDPFDRLLGLGILLTVVTQALVNLMVVTGMAPTKGIALPLVSAGGTGWVFTAAALGLVVALGRAVPETPTADEFTGAPRPLLRGS